MNNYIDSEIKRLLKETDDLEVPSHVTNSINNILNELPDMKGEKQVKKPNRYVNTIFKKVAKASIIVLALLGVSISTSAFAGDNSIKQIINLAVEKVKPKSSNPFETFTNYKNASLDKYKTVIEKSVTDNGITIQLNEIIMDSEELLITYTVNQEKEDISKLYAPYVHIFINGKELHRRGGGSHIDISKTSRRYLDSRSLDDSNYDGDLNFKISFGNDPFNELNKDFWNGKWEFEFTTNRESIMADIKKISLDKQIKLPNNDLLNISNIIISPISTTINTNSEHKGNDTKDIDSIYPTFKLFDQNGNVLNPTSFGWSMKVVGDAMLSKGIHRYKNIDSGITKIKIVPYLDRYSMTSTVNKELAKSSFEIELDK